MRPAVGNHASAPRAYRAGRPCGNGMSASGHTGVVEGMSGITGNCYVPFLGGWGAAMLPGYPARIGDVMPVRSSFKRKATPFC